MVRVSRCGVNGPVVKFNPRLFWGMGPGCTKGALGGHPLFGFEVERKGTTFGSGSMEFERSGRMGDIG